MTGITRLLADHNNPRSLSSRARERRWNELLRRFPALDSMKVLDLGGTPAFWRAAPVQPAHVTLVNLGDVPCDEPWMTLVVGDACASEVSGPFDVVISNSLLEHVGGHYRRRQLAATIRDAAPYHWVQTPYRYFPVEPHWVAPGMQLLPIAARAFVSKHWPLDVHYAKGEPVDSVLGVELLSLSEMRHYFPDSDIWKERFAGLPKSIVAVRAPA